MDTIRILIVDDEHQFVDAVVERFRLRGFKIDGVTNGKDALYQLDQNSYDVVLLDVKMPGLSGLEIIKEIKEKWPNLQVIMLTGHGSSKDAEAGMLLGAFRYMMKPVNFNELISIICTAAQHKGDDKQ